MIGCPWRLAAKRGEASMADVRTARQVFDETTNALLERFGGTAPREAATKRRHRLDPDYFSRLDPSHASLPISERAAAKEAVVFAHTLLLAEFSP